MPRKLPAGAGAPAAAPSEERVRKNMDMDANKLHAARRILGTRTDTETIDHALDYVIFQGEVFGALDALAALGGLDDIDEPARPKRHVAERRRER